MAHMIFKLSAYIQRFLNRYNFHWVQYIYPDNSWVPRWNVHACILSVCLDRPFKREVIGETTTGSLVTSDDSTLRRCLNFLVLHVFVVIGLFDSLFLSYRAFTVHWGISLLASLGSWVTVYPYCLQMKKPLPIAGETSNVSLFVLIRSKSKIRYSLVMVYY